MKTSRSRAWWRDGFSCHRTVDRSPSARSRTLGEKSKSSPSRARHNDGFPHPNPITPLPSAPMRQVSFRRQASRGTLMDEDDLFEEELFGDEEIIQILRDASQVRRSGIAA
jgi:hypothetical protein